MDTTSSIKRHHPFRDIGIGLSVGITVSYIIWSGLGFIGWFFFWMFVLGLVCRDRYRLVQRSDGEWYMERRPYDG